MFKRLSKNCAHLQACWNQTGVSGVMRQRFYHWATPALNIPHPPEQGNTGTSCDGRRLEVQYHLQTDHFNRPFSNPLSLKIIFPSTTLIVHPALLDDYVYMTSENH